jgi:CRISPR-associated protein Cmr1
MRRIKSPNQKHVEALQKKLQSVAAAPKDVAAPWQEYLCTLVTPLYGGGVKAGEVDTAMPIRASAIRGQLRFWWRIACRPFADAKEMLKRETEIWGGISDKGATASKVDLRVTFSKDIMLDPAFKFVADPNKPGQFKSMPQVEKWANAYALFSAQGKLKPDKRSIEVKPNPLGLEGFVFTLQMRVAADLTPEQQAEIKQALRWWSSFGGVGARTRRGLGAVQVKDVKPVTVSEVLSKGGVLKLKTASDKTTAWKNAVEALRVFRQGAEVGRNKADKADVNTKSPAGRSRWPEADTVRELSGCSSERHKNRIVSGRWFPRAAFGLPIVFHFQNDPKPTTGSQEPADHILEPANVRDKQRDRMASPLVLRPYSDGEKWYSAALLLPSWERALNIELKFHVPSDNSDNSVNEAPQLWPAADEREQAAKHIKPMCFQNQPRALDPLSAFMDFFEKGK